MLGVALVVAWFIYRRSVAYEMPGGEVHGAISRQQAAPGAPPALTYGTSSLAWIGGIAVLRIVGDAHAIGAAHGRLLAPWLPPVVRAAAPSIEETVADDGCVRRARPTRCGSTWRWRFIDDGLIDQDRRMVAGMTRGAAASGVELSYEELRPRPGGARRRRALAAQRRGRATTASRTASPSIGAAGAGAGARVDRPHVRAARARRWRRLGDPGRRRSRSPRAGSRGRASAGPAARRGHRRQRAGHRGDGRSGAHQRRPRRRARRGRSRCSRARVLEQAKTLDEAIKLDRDHADARRRGDRGRRRHERQVGGRRAHAEQGDRRAQSEVAGARRRADDERARRAIRRTIARAACCRRGPRRARARSSCARRSPTSRAMAAVLRDQRGARRRAAPARPPRRDRRRPRGARR